MAAVVLDPHQRCLAQLAAARADGREDDDRQPGVPQRRRLGAAGALVGLDLLAHPSDRDRLVFALQWHATYSTAGASFPCERSRSRTRTHAVTTPSSATLARTSSSPTASTSPRCGPSGMPAVRVTVHSDSRAALPATPAVASHGRTRVLARIAQPSWPVAVTAKKEP